ncbi:putative Metal ion transporter C27B12.12c [Seiridium unicorne]|uniref:Metal ion transporter C27B12.12c n=1 Tax=Seiridium unicorne TaxID=138068 RepID=A0ABR2VAI5_9PEZI
MSDHEEVSVRGGYHTPVPELDDHRHQTASQQRLERPRRGTVDTLYGSRNDLPVSPLDIRVRDFEEAVIDEDGGDMSPTLPRIRRPTVETNRSVSPPNSVKAFAEARRRERLYSVSSDPRDKGDKGDAEKLQRTFSTNSRRSERTHRSGRSRPMTVENDAASLHTNKSAEDDVCFPLQEEHRRDELYIDFDYLENFVASDMIEHDEAPGAARIFPNLQPDPSIPSASPMVTIDGDIINPPAPNSVADEKGDMFMSSGASDVPVREHVDPNRFSFFSSTWESTIHAASFGGLVLPGESVRGLFTFPQDEQDGVWWLNVNNPTEDEVRAICKAFGIHPLTIEDITVQETREKIELFPSYYFACFRSFTVIQEEDGPDYEPFNIYTIVFREGTLSFSFQPNEHAKNVRARITMLKDYLSLSSDWICYALIDNIVDTFAPAIHRIELQTESIEDSVFIARAEDMHTFLRKIGAVRKNTLGLMRILGGKADVLKGFAKRCNENYRVTPRMDIGMYLGDIQDHVVTMMTNLTHFEKILSRAHSNYLAQLTIDSITQGTKTNEGLAKITFLASVIVPLNVITGLFGMNVKVPWQSDYSDNLNAFGGIVATMITVSLLALYIAKRAKYI